MTAPTSLLGFVDRSLPPDARHCEPPLRRGNGGPTGLRVRPLDRRLAALLAMTGVGGGQASTALLVAGGAALRLASHARSTPMRTEII